MSELREIALRPIGYVRSEFREWAPSDEMREQASQLVIREELAAGLDGLAAGDAILVLYYFHQADGYRLRRHPRDDTDEPQRGLFALRTQYRPNGIGATIAQIESIQHNVVQVRGLDALDGSPLLDIKPYSPGFDSPDEEAMKMIDSSG